MIGTITTGNSFRRLFNYLTKETKKHQIIGGTFFGTTSKEIINDFELVANLRPTTKKPVKHFVVSFAPQDGKIDDYDKYLIAMEIVQKMGYTDNQWIAVSHHRDDPDHEQAHDHDHMHIMVNMITSSGQRIEDSFDKWKMQTVLRALEIKHNLTQVQTSLMRNRRRPQQGRFRTFEKAMYRYIKKAEKYIANTTSSVPIPPREPEIQELETFIEAASSDNPTMSEYIARMQQLGYRIEQYYGKTSKRTGKPRIRFRYFLKSNGKPITKVKGGTRAQLLKAGVSYIPERDDPIIAQANQGITLKLPNLRPVTAEMVAKERYKWLSLEKQKLLEKIRLQLSQSETSQVQENTQTKNWEL